MFSEYEEYYTEPSEADLIIEEAKPEEVNPESITLTTENNVTTCKAGESIRVTATVLPAEANQSV